MTDKGPRLSSRHRGPVFGRIGKEALKAWVVVLLASAITGLGLPAAEAQASVTELTLSGSVTTGLDVPTDFGGRLTVDSVGVPLQEVAIEVDGSVAGSASTDNDGFYAVTISFGAYGLKELQAVAYGGTALEERSELLTVEVVPDYDDSVATDIHESTSFLYTGANAPQTGVAPGTIKPRRAAVVRGAITDATGDVLEGVEVTIPGHPELGETTTRPDGTFDMAVNGGSELVVRYEKQGYIPVERVLDPAWRDFEVAAETVMIPYDDAVTTVDLSATTEVQVARGSTVTDQDGTRQATLLFEPGTQAEMVFADGTTQALDSAQVRATEYTVGDNGESAMPAALPPLSGYTYAVEFSVDEAIAASATDVRFDEPVVSYVENFLGFPVGTRVPAGYYDRAEHAWVASDDGRVIEIVSITAGKADLDGDGDGVADTGSALTDLGVTDSEREELAQLYAVGQSLWRVEVTHFTPWDWNWPFGLPLGALAPLLDWAIPDVDDEMCTQSGSIIECENQALGEIIPIAGTPFVLRYDSARVPGRKVARSLRIPLSKATLPEPLKRITLDVTIAGRTFSSVHDPVPNLIETFTWDGKDAYGRPLQGKHPAKVRIGYVYQGVYGAPSPLRPGFGQPGVSDIGVTSRGDITISQTYTVPIGALTAEGPQSIGGWTISAHHGYDPNHGVLYLGSGGRRSANALLPGLANYAGDGDAGPGGDGTYSGDGGPATEGGLSRVKGIEAGPDGSLYIADAGNGVVRRVNPAGTISTFAGGGVPASGNGDGGPATDAELGSPVDVAIAAEGSVLILDAGEGNVRKVAPDGTISTIAGGGNPADGLGDDGPATDAKLLSPSGIAVGPGDSLFVADTGHNRVRMVDAAGIITTVAGGGSPADGLGDGQPGPKAALDHPLDVAVSAQGDLFISDSDHYRLRRLGSDGILTTVAGTGVAGYTGDGGPATEADLQRPFGVEVDANGNLYIVQGLHHRIRKVSGEGIITTIAGTGSAGFGGAGGPPARATLNNPRDVAIDPEGQLYVADTDNFRIRRVEEAMPGFSTSDLLVGGGDEVYHFDENGRHLRTLDALTGELIYSFQYTAGRLDSITDNFGNVTSVERNPGGDPTAIVSPFGVRTNLSLGANGYLAQVENAETEVTLMTYKSGGLLETFTTPSGTSTFTYDEVGRLINDIGPDGHSVTLDRTFLKRGARVDVTSAEGVTTSYEIKRLDSDEVKRTVAYASGTAVSSVLHTDGTMTVTSPDGTVTTARFAPDPRWGMQSPIAEDITATRPSSVTTSVRMSRAVNLSDAADPLSLSSQTETITAGSGVFTRSFDGPTRALTITTPEGRTSTTTFNAGGLVASIKHGSLATSVFAYDSFGRMTSVSRTSGGETRNRTFTYDANGFVASVADPLHQTAYVNDDVGRPSTVTLADDNQIGFAYDASGNLDSLTPPGRPAHGFDHTEADLLERYSAPMLGGSAFETSYQYDFDRRPTLVDRPGPGSIGLTYDPVGRLDSATIARGLIDYSYDPDTSQVVQIDAPGGVSTGFTYDGSLVTSVTAQGIAPGSVAYGYNSDARMSSLTVGASPEIGFGYDGDGLLTAAGSLSLTWDPADGQLNSTSLGTIATTHDYNAFGEPTSDAATAGAAEMYSASYTRDELGRIATKTETIEGASTTYAYTYDDRGRLTDVSVGGIAVEHYDYDANGNRTAAMVDSQGVTADYDDQDRLTRYRDTAFTYTPDGQLATATIAGATTTYDYDELGNLLGVDLSDGTAVDYVVDGLGRRVARNVDGTTTHRFLYGTGLLPVAEIDGSGDVTTTYVYGSQGHVPDYMVRGGATYRFVTDQVGSVRLVVDSSTGDVVQRLDYDSFGNVTQDTNPGFQPFGFAGGLYDPTTGLVRFGLRDYDAETGRWTAKDPISFDGGDTNLYAYSFNDPINFIDPTGLNPLDWIRDKFDAARCLVAGIGDVLYNWSGWDEMANVSAWVAKGTALTLCVISTLGACAAAGAGLTWMETLQDVSNGQFSVKRTIVYALWNGVPLLGGVGNKFAVEGLKKLGKYAFKFYVNYPSLLCSVECEMPR